MGIFEKKASAKGATKAKATKAKAKPVTEEVLTPESQQASGASTKAVTAAKGQAGMSYRVLHSPRVSEKAAIMSQHNVYVLNVPVTVNKIEIARAVKDLYGVTVEAVRTVRGIGKKMVRGRVKGERNRWKKAYVTVKKGEKIDLYEGV